MRRLLNILAAIMVAGSASATLDVRHYYLTNDVSAAAVAVSPLKWQQGESVKIDLYARRGTTAIDLTGVTTVRMETTHPTNLTQLYMCETGTVASATNGYVTFDISPANANLPTSNLYTAYMRCYTYTNSENRYVGDIYKGPVYVLFGPSATNVIWRGPYTNAVESDPVYSAWSSTNAWLTQAATTAQGYVNGLSNNVIRLQTNDLVIASNALNSATIAGNTASTNYASGISNNLAALIVYSIMTNVVSGNTASSNYTAGVSNNAFAYTDLKAGIAGTNAHDTLLDLAGTRAISGPALQFSNNGVVSGAIARVRNDYLIDYWSDNIYRLMGYQSPAAGGALGAGNVNLQNDWLGMTIGTNMQFNGATFTLGLAGSQISGGVATNMEYHGNGRGVTNLPMIRATAGVLWFTESSNGETTELYHITSTYRTNKIGSFWTTP